MMEWSTRVSTPDFFPSQSPRYCGARGYCSRSMSPTADWSKGTPIVSRIAPRKSPARYRNSPGVPPSANPVAFRMAARSTRSASRIAYSISPSRVRRSARRTFSASPFDQGAPRIVSQSFSFSWEQWAVSPLEGALSISKGSPPSRKLENIAKGPAPPPVLSPPPQSPRPQPPPALRGRRPRLALRDLEELPAGLRGPARLPLHPREKEIDLRPERSGGILHGPCAQCPRRGRLPLLAQELRVVEEDVVEIVRGGEVLQRLLEDDPGPLVLPGPEKGLRVFAVEGHGKPHPRQLPLPAPLPQAVHRKHRAVLHRVGEEVLQVRFSGVFPPGVPFLRIPPFFHQACRDESLGRLPPVARDLPPGGLEMLPCAREVIPLHRSEGLFVFEIRDQGGFREGGDEPVVDRGRFRRLPLSCQGESREVKNVIPEIVFPGGEGAKRFPRLGELLLGQEGPSLAEQVVRGGEGFGPGGRGNGKQKGE